MPTHPRLGTLKPDPRTSGYWSSDPVPCSAFNDQLVPFTFYDLIDSAAETLPVDVAAAVEAVLNLGPRLHQATAAVVYSVYREFVEAVGEDEFDFVIASPQDVWRHVHLKSIDVERSSRDHQVYTTFACECDWEVEHGLQIVLRNGRTLSKVSAQGEGLGDDSTAP